jgi:D-methionine transport system ATP-binding protein
MLTWTLEGLPLLASLDHREVNGHGVAWPPPAAVPAAPPPGIPVVRIAGLVKRFGAHAALDGVSLEVRRGEILGVIGRSGAGKSTLIRCLNGLERPDEGRVEIEGRDIAGLPERALAPIRGRIGMIFQHFNLLSAKTVAENIALPLKIAGRPKAERARRVAELLGLVGLSDKADAFPAALSGGQKQRVGIARALAAEPALLLSDEATSALDPETTLSILELLRDINRRLGLTIVLITHEMSVVRAIADRVAVLDRGRIVEEGPVWDVLAQPSAALTRSLVRALTPALPAIVADRLTPEPPSPLGATAQAVLRVDFRGTQAREPVLADFVLATGLRPAILHGTVDHIRDRPVGSLVVAVPYQGEFALRRALGQLEPHVAAIEILGYVERAP